VPFSEPHSGSFSNARFFRHAKLSPGRESEVLARFDNGDPAVISVPHGRGRVIVLAFSADDSGNDLPLKSVYAPFWQQLLQTIQSGQRERHYYEVGQTIEPKAYLASVAALRGIQGPAAGDNVVVLDPQKARVALAPGADAAELGSAGFFDLRTARFNAAVAVNPVPRESDLARGNAEEMVASWMSGRSAAPSQSVEEPVSPDELDRRQGIWKILLAAAILMLLAEGLLAGRLSPKAGRQPV
jgi:hypothetical protein